MKADYELRHQLYGRQGSLWEKQVDAPTRQMIRTIVTEAGNAPLLAQLDALVTSALGGGDVLAEDEFFNFTDGNFAVVGKLQKDYLHRKVVDSEGSTIYVGYRTSTGSYSATPETTVLSRVTDSFLRCIQSAGDLLSYDATRDWYLIPMPRHLRPIVIQGKSAGDYLVQGVDFLSFDGYIAMPDSPLDALPLGVVRISSAYKRVVAADSSGFWVTDYRRRTQSVEACRRAAAEYAGLYVCAEDDVVLSAHSIGAGIMLYTLRDAGGVEITYPHVQLVAGQSLTKGYIICQRFDLVQSDTTNSAMKNAMTGWSAPVSLDGVLPVNGLTWDGRPIMIEAGETDTLTGKLHTRLMFDGAEDTRERFWRLCAMRERTNGIFLSDVVGPSFPISLDGWELFQQFYGKQLLLAIAADHGPTINSRLRWFLVEHHPSTCNLLLSMDMPYSPVELAIGSNGEPLVDEYGEYVSAPAYEVDFPLSLSGSSLWVNGNPLTYT